MKKFVSEPYWISPEGLKVDEKIAGFNPPKITEEYESLKHLIRTSGQTQPIYLRNGLVGDGRTRAQIARELGREVYAIDVNPDMEDTAYIAMCNENTFGSRNDSGAQKAIKAYKLIKQHKFTETEAKLVVGIKDKNVLGYVKTIADSAYKEFLDDIHNNKPIELVDVNKKMYRGCSLRTISGIIKKLEEESILETDTSEEIKEIEIDYNRHINTETAKDVFWVMYGKSELSHEAKVLVCEMLNLKYKKKSAVQVDECATAGAEGDEKVNTYEK